MVQVISKQTLQVERGKATFAEGFDIRHHISVNKPAADSNGKSQGGAVAEFISTGNFAPQFFQRQKYEVDAGRDSEPILYTAIYDVTTDPNLPRLVPINTIGPTGVVFEKIVEGGEVKFVSVSQGTKSVEIFHYGVGLEYDEDLFIYNELWRLPNIERRFGTAFNALQNHIHFVPILTFTYQAANQTNGTTLQTFRANASMPEKYLRTLEAAIAAGIVDETNPRRGPYMVVCATADLFTLERALNRVPQQGFDQQSSAIGQIQGLIAYDGWTGMRGKIPTVYPGVSAGKAYLVDIGNRMIDFQSYIKTPFRRQSQAGDLTRFVIEQVVYDSRFGLYCNPEAAVHEITLPSASSGVAGS